MAMTLDHGASYPNFTPASPKLMRRMNLDAVLQTIRSGGTVSRLDIAAATRLSKPTINEVLRVLLEAGYVREELPSDNEATNRRPGPRPRMLALRADFGHVLGIDIGANKILVLVADLSGTIVASVRRPIGEENRLNLETLLAEVCSAVEAALGSAEISASSLKATVVGTPGVINPSSGRVSLAPQLPCLEGVGFGQLLAGYLPNQMAPTIVENEVYLSLLAERWRGAARTITDALYVQIGYCIGAAILIGGELHRGACGAAGEIGYLPLFTDGGRATDGRGPFEWAAGGDAFARMGREVAATRKGKLLREMAGNDDIDAVTLFAAAQRGDAAAKEIIDDLVSRLAVGIATAAIILNPEAVIIGGGISRAGGLLIEPLEARIRGLVPVPPRVFLSRLGEEAVALGAVHVALGAVDESILSSLSLELSGPLPRSEKRAGGLPITS